MNYDSQSLRFYVYMRHKLGEKSVAIHEDIVKIFGNVIAVRTVQHYVKEFKDGRNTTTDLRIFSGRPKNDNHEELIHRVRDEISTNQNLTIDALAEMLDSSHGVIQRIIHDDLQLRSVCQKWIPHYLTVIMKQNRVTAANLWLPILRNRDQLSRIIMVDEKWFYYRSIANSLRC